jgi:DNA-binding transcriptional LysR family regulator
MNIQAIRLFLHVVQRGSLAAAAQELNMSPSAASRLLSGLEHATGLKLFSRDGHSLRPTAEGTQYFDECYRVLIAVDELPHAARRLASGAQPRLRVTSGSRHANSLMIPAIGRFAKRYPDVEIEFHLAQVQGLDRLLSERYDVSVATPWPAITPFVETSPLIDLPAVAVMPRDHALAGTTSVGPADLVAHRMIATPMGPMRDDLEHLFRSQGVELRPQYTANDVEHGCSLLLQVGGVMIADPLVPLAVGPDLFAMVPLKPLRMVRTSICSPVLKPESRLTAEFKACLREEAQSIQQRIASLLGDSDAARKAAMF